MSERVTRAAALRGPGAPVGVVFDGGAPRLATRTRTLRSGLDVVVHPDASSPQVAVSVWYRVGSSDERPGRTGFAHLFEHLFKSSPERLGGHHYEVLKRAGSSEANASTSADRSACASQRADPKHRRMRLQRFHPKPRATDHEA